MLPVILLAGAALLGAGVALYWKEIKAWLKRIWDKLPESIKSSLQGALSFAKKVANTCYNIMKYYSYNESNKQWSETVVTTEVSESKIPDHIRSKIKANLNSEIDTTQELQDVLELKLT